MALEILTISGNITASALGFDGNKLQFESGALASQYLMDNRLILESKYPGHRFRIAPCGQSAQACGQSAQAGDNKSVDKFLDHLESFQDGSRIRVAAFETPLRYVALAPMGVPVLNLIKPSFFGMSNHYGSDFFSRLMKKRKIGFISLTKEEIKESYISGEFNRDFKRAIICNIDTEKLESWKQINFRDSQTYKNSKYVNFHFLHVSSDNPAQVAYYENHEKFIQGRLNRCGFGRYLKRWFSDVLDGPQISNLTAEFLGNQIPGVLKFAKSRDEIARVYRDGPSSCMGGKPDSHFFCGFQPTEVYAAGELAVAYMEREGRITARALCHLDKKIYTRIYGDSVRFCPVLERAGYEENRGGFDGVKLLHLVSENGFSVLPYLDCNRGVTVIDNKYLKIGGTDLSAVSEYGYADPDEEDENSDNHSCNECGEMVHGDDQHVLDYNILCECCYCEISFTCEQCDESYDSRVETTYHVKDAGRWGKDVCENCANTYFSYCNSCNEYFESTREVFSTGDQICAGCAKDEKLKESLCNDLLDSVCDPCDCTICDSLRDNNKMKKMQTRAGLMSLMFSPHKRQRTDPVPVPPSP